MKKKPKIKEQVQTGPIIQQIGEEWCLLKADGTKDVCFASKEKAELEAQKRYVALTGSKETINEQAMITSPDPRDGHVHAVEELSDDGSGKTAEASGPKSEPHAHMIENFEVVSMKSADGSYVSAHPGSLAEEAGSEAEEAKKKKLKGMLMPYGASESAILARFGESGPADTTGKVWKVVMLEEGMSKNGRLYTRELIRDLASRKIFENTPAFGFVFRTPDGLILDHAPDGVDSKNFAKDVAGFHKNVRAEEGENGKLALVSDFHFMDEVLQKKALEAWKGGNKGLFGFSIDAIGEGDEIGNGKVEIKYIVRANSDDLVSAPAAGGRFVRMVASAAKSGKLLREDGSMDTKALLVQLIQAVKPALLEGKDVSALSLEDVRKMTEGDEFKAAKAALAAIGIEDRKTAPAASPAPVATAPAASAVETAALVNEAVKKALEPLVRARHRESVEAAIKDASLPEEGAKLVRDLAEKSVGDETHLKASVERARKVLESGGWESPKLGTVTVGDEVRDKHMRAIEGAIVGRPQKGTAPFKSIKHMAQVLTGRIDFDHRDVMAIANAAMNSVCARWADFRANGAKNGGAITESYRQRVQESARRRFTSLKEAINLAQLTEIFGDSITRQMIADYELPQLNDWRAIASKIGFVDDTRVQRRERLGYYGDLATVAEGASYAAITSLTDEEVSITVEKHGNFESLTEEAILRNDLGWFAKIPMRLAKAAMQDVRKTVWNLVDPSTNPVIYDAAALFTVGAPHNNRQAATLSVASLSTTRQQMREQTTYGTTFNELGAGNVPKFLVVPAELENVANQITSSQWEATSNLFQVANLHKGINVIVVDHFTDADAFVAVADPANTPTIEVDFVGSSDAPEIWTQDDPTQGSPFDSDTIKVKVRNWFGVAVLEYRGMAAGIP